MSDTFINVVLTVENTYVNKFQHDVSVLTISFAIPYAIVFIWGVVSVYFSSNYPPLPPYYRETVFLGVEPTPTFLSDVDRDNDTSHDFHYNGYDMHVLTHWPPGDLIDSLAK